MWCTSTQRYNTPLLIFHFPRVRDIWYCNSSNDCHEQRRRRRSNIWRQRPLYVIKNGGPCFRARFKRKHFKQVYFIQIWIKKKTKKYVFIIFLQRKIKKIIQIWWEFPIVIPILKPGKDKTDAASYRPIALTSCLCKILERMVNARLMWHLEKNNFLCAEQSGFRRNRSVTDNLTQLEGLIQDSFLTRKHLIAVFFDLEKAYDTTWKYGIL